MTNNPKTRLLIEAITSHFLAFRSLNAKRILGVGFLCDWKHCIEFGTPITECKWSIMKNWVHSEEFMSSLYSAEFLQFSDMKLIDPPIQLSKPSYPYQKGTSQDTVCQHVFSALDTRNEFDMDKIILSTYPFDRTGPINMMALSKEYTSKYGCEYTGKKRA